MGLEGGVIRFFGVAGKGGWSGRCNENEGNMVMALEDVFA